MEDSFHLIMQIIQRKYNHLFALFYILVIVSYITRTNCEVRVHNICFQERHIFTIYLEFNLSSPDCIQFYCSTAKPKLNHRLSSLQQQALCSFTIINIMMHYSRQDSIKEGMSLRELIINRQKFNYLAALALNNQKYSRIWNYVNEEWITVNISQQNYQTVIKGFQLKYGAYLDYRIWSQYRVSTLTQSGFVPLFPTLTTGLYYARLYRSCNTVFSGEAGIGKTFSFCSFSYLCSFVLAYRYYIINKNMEKIITKNASGEQVIQTKKISKIFANDKICKIVKPSFFELIPNVCYMSLKQEQNLTAYYDQIKLQFPNIASAEYLDLKYKVNKGKGISLQIFNEMLKHIKIIADQKGIKRLLVIDEAHKLFQLLRQLSRSINNKQPWKSSKTFKTLTFYDQLLKTMVEQGQSKFDWVFLNSSQYFQLQFITNLQQSNIDQIKTLTTLFQSDKIKDIGSKCEYSSLMQSQIGHFELLNTFWFQILFYFSNFLQKRKSILHDSQLLVHKKCFNQTFKIPSRQQIEADPTCLNRMERWNNDVRQLQIRQLLQNVKNNPPKCLQVTSQHIFFKENPSQQQLQQFSNGLKLLKKSIQSYRLQDIISAILKYLQKTLYLSQLTIGRFTMLQRLQAEAESYAQQMSHNPEKNNRYIYLKQSTFSNFDKQVLIQEWGFGYFDVDKNQLTFSIDPQILLLVIRKTNKKNQFTKIMMKVVHQMSFKGSFNSNFNSLFGRLIDHINFSCFSTSKLSLKLKRYYSQQHIYSRDKEENKQFEQVRYSLARTIPFSGFKNISNLQRIMNKRQEQTSKQFKRIKRTLQVLLDEVNKNENVNMFIGGFPVVFYSQDDLTQYSIFEDNQLFDCLFLKKNQTSNYEMVLIDWTMGRVQNKFQKDFQDLIRIFLNFLNIKENIKCSFIIAGPEYYVKEHFQNKANKTLKCKLSEQTDQFVWQVQFMVSSFDQQLPFILSSSQQAQIIGLELLSAIYKNIDLKQGISALKKRK